MASAADTSVSSPPTPELVKERIQHLLSTRANSPPSTTDHHIENEQACLSLTELCREYKNHYNECVPYRELGYDTLTRFLSSMKDVVRMNSKEWPAKCYLRRITNRQVDNKTTPTYDLVKVRIQHVLSTTDHHTENKQTCLSLTELCRGYENRYHERVPYKELGYDTLSHFLLSMKDVVRMNSSEWPAKCYLQRVTDRQADNKTTEEINKRQFTVGSSNTYENIKMNIIWLLESAAETNGSTSLTLKELCDQYAKKNKNQSLPFEQLGYSSLEDLLATMWDRIAVNGQSCYLTPKNKDRHKKAKK